MIPILAYYFNDSKSKNIKSSLKRFFPLFVLGFIALSIIRTLGDFYFIETTFNERWSNMIFLCFFTEGLITLVLMDLEKLEKIQQKIS